MFAKKDGARNERQVCRTTLLSLWSTGPASPSALCTYTPTGTSLCQAVAFRAGTFSILLDPSASVPLVPHARAWLTDAPDARNGRNGSPLGHSRRDIKWPVVHVQGTTSGGGTVVPRRASPTRPILQDDPGHVKAQWPYSWAGLSAGPSWWPSGGVGSRTMLVAATPDKGEREGENEEVDDETPLCRK